MEGMSVIKKGGLNNTKGFEAAVVCLKKKMEEEGRYVVKVSLFTRGRKACFIN